MTVTLTNEDVYRQIQAGDVTLAFDTSVTVRRGFLALCEQANRINAKRDAFGLAGRIRLCVPAAAHTERLFDLAQEYGDEYNVGFVRGILSRFRITVPDFTVSDAEHCAALLARRYKTPAEWHAFKKKRCLECVGLPPEQHALARGSGQKCGAPNDWLIIAQASRGNMVLVMDDKGRGDGYALVERVARSDDVREALEQVLGELVE
jgi:hypothetical protein